MQELINILKVKYDMLCSDQTELTQKMIKQGEEIAMVKEALEQPENFDDDDINELISMLSSEDQEKLKNIKVYLKLFGRFNNQPQIIRAKEIYEDIKKKINAYFDNEYNTLVSLQQESEAVAALIRDISDKIKTYNNETYIDAASLNYLIGLLRNSDVTPAVIEFYKQVLYNNSQLQYRNEENNISDTKIELDLNNYLNRLTKINKSLMHDTLHDDELVFNFLSAMVDNDKVIVDDKKSCDLVMKLLTNQMGTEYGKRLKFLIHLYFSEIEYVPEQVEFLHQIQQAYSDKIRNNHNKDIIKRNMEFINSINSSECFDNIDLLSDVFNDSEISPLIILKIITGIIYRNEQKDTNKKCKVKQ